MRHVMILLLIAGLILAGCASEQKVVVTNQPPAEEPSIEPTPVVERSVETAPPKAETCEDKAKKLFPGSISLTLSASKNPDSDGWEIVDGAKWSDGLSMEFKGDIQFQKGRYSGESAEKWYTRNIQNEKLFGVGGLKYSKQKTVGKTEFIVKVTLDPIKINPQADEFTPHTGTFKIADSTFSECSWAE